MGSEKQIKDKATMYLFNFSATHQKYFAACFTLGFLFKYNYLFLQIFQVPSITGLILKNCVLVLIIYLMVLPLLQNRKARKAVFIFLLVFTGYFLSTLWYYRYFGNYLSLNDMLMGRGARPVDVLFKQISRPYDIFFVLDLIILFYFVIRDKATAPLRSVFPGAVKPRLAVILPLITVLIFAQIYLTSLILGNEKPIALFNKSTSAFVNVYGILPLYAFEYYSFYAPARFENPDIRPPSVKNSITETEINAKTPDIVAIQVESLDRKIIDYKHNGTEITPFLNELKDKGLYFENFYAQHVNGSFDAEFSFLTSTYPVNKNYAFKTCDLSDFDSLVKVLKEKGYQTYAFHSNDKRFFHRHRAFPDLGFDKFYSQKDFPLEKNLLVNYKSDFGTNDYDFFIQSADYLKEAESPFFAFFITATSHTPFDFYPLDQDKEQFRDIDNDLVRDYFKSMSFVDKSLKRFFRELRALSLFEDTLFIIYSDHESTIDTENYSSKRKFVLKKEVKAPENIPLFIIHSDIEPAVLNEEGTHADIAPTILDLLGEEQRPGEFLGRSLLEKERSPVLFIHETPQILYDGQLFASFPEGIDKIGYLEERGNKDVGPPNEKDLVEAIDFMKHISFKRRMISN